jgi:hypothetical protein
VFRLGGSYPTGLLPARIDAPGCSTALPHDIPAGPFALERARRGSKLPGRRVNQAGRLRPQPAGRMASRIRHGQRRNAGEHQQVQPYLPSTLIAQHMPAAIGITRSGTASLRMVPSTGSGDDAWKRQDGAHPLCMRGLDITDPHHMTHRHKIPHRELRPHRVRARHADWQRDILAECLSLLTPASGNLPETTVGLIILSCEDSIEGLAAPNLPKNTRRHSRVGDHRSAGGPHRSIRIPPSHEQGLGRSTHGCNRS